MDNQRVHGDIGDMDTTSFGSLAAGKCSCNQQYGKLVGEDAFPTVSHEGEKKASICVWLAKFIGGGFWWSFNSWF